MTSNEAAAFGLVLAAVLALPAAAANHGTRTITVVGTGEAESESAAGEWTLVVKVENEKARTALRGATTAVARVRSALLTGGVTDFETGRMSLDALTGDERSGSFRGFAASTRIEFSLADVQRAATVLDRVRATGATEIYGPAAPEETSQELMRRALADGMDDAVERRDGWPRKRASRSVPS